MVAEELVAGEDDCIPSNGFGKRHPAAG
jgi:hypothetical protein